VLTYLPPTIVQNTTGMTHIRIVYHIQILCNPGLPQIHKNQIQQNLCSMNTGSQNRTHRSQAWKIVRTAYSIHKLMFLIIQ